MPTVAVRPMPTRTLAHPHARIHTELHADYYNQPYSRPSDVSDGRRRPPSSPPITNTEVPGSPHFTESYLPPTLPAIQAANVSSTQSLWHLHSSLMRSRRSPCGRRCPFCGQLQIPVCCFVQLSLFGSSLAMAMMMPSSSNNRS